MARLPSSLPVRYRIVEGQELLNAVADRMPQGGAVDWLQMQIANTHWDAGVLVLEVKVLSLEYGKEESSGSTTD